MKYHILVRRLAERDLEEAEDWYNEQQSGLGTEFRGVIFDLFERLTDNPRIYPRVHAGVHRAVLRRFPYLVYFLIEGSHVIVLCGPGQQARSSRSARAVRRITLSVEGTEMGIGL